MHAHASLRKVSRRNAEQSEPVRRSTSTIFLCRCPDFFSRCIFSVFLYLCVVLLSHQTLFHCAGGKISRWRGEGKQQAGVDVCF